jgi:tRNA (guanine-N7-)-methyltransferase
VAPTTLEIGFGNGDSLLAQALANPDRNFIGVEVHRPGVGRFLARVHQQELFNVRVFCADAVPLLEARIVPGSLDCVQVYFPDPWPKKRHHKRRLVQSGFADLVARALGPCGRWLLATDWADYAEQMRDTLNAHAGFVNLAPDGGFLPRPPERMETKFERRGRQLGHAVFDLAYQRKAT